MKQKTNKAASKRFHFTARGKARRRHVKQSHFNARADGNENRRKHVEQAVDRTDLARLTELLPYG